ncbi:flagellar motor protein MotB [Planococcus halotolerans]|uniref:Flagellar motor protein MotB n=1 Tax=Planococcus halotolerans TaxID=2233542 RepID=A0A365KQS9_9BACL|nr:flagellar motor protein MotB [Planococcus halotolerans]RAZ75526.1 flagellar motor protein MotB [Planococcus halotolerans]
MSALKRKKKHEDHVDESWLIPYADVLTLLLALFIVLFAASEVNSQKFQEISDSFNQELQGGTGILDQQSAVETFEETSKLAEPNDVDPTEGEATTPPEVEEEINDKIEMTAEEIEQLALAEDYKELAAIQDKVKAYIAERNMEDKLEAELTSKGLVLKIKDGVLYRSGSADISEGSRTVTEEIGKMLVTDPPRSIFIEGHTDNIPSTSDKYPSNWELSSARAINFMKILLENNDLDPTKFSATGFAEHQPIASNDTAEGRAENRRVEVLISLYAHEETD